MKRFELVPLQAAQAREMLVRFGMEAGQLSTVVLVEGERAFVRSTAMLRILRGLGWPWWVLAALVVVPGPIRDGVYDWIARNRYRVWGNVGCRLQDAD